MMSNCCLASAGRLREAGVMVERKVEEGYTAEHLWRPIFSKQKIDKKINRRIKQIIRPLSSGIEIDKHINSHPSLQRSLIDQQAKDKYVQLLKSL